MNIQVKNTRERTIVAKSGLLPTTAQAIRERAHPLKLLTVGLAGLLAREATEHLWSTATGREPPDDPTRAHVGLREAVAWTIAIGVAIGVARLIAGRATSQFIDGRD